MEPSNSLVYLLNSCVLSESRKSEWENLSPDNQSIMRKSESGKSVNHEVPVQFVLKLVLCLWSFHTCVWRGRSYSIPFLTQSLLGEVLTFFLHYLFCALTDPISARGSCQQYGETWAHQEPNGACSSTHSQAYHQKDAVPSTNCPSAKYDRTHYLWPPLMAEATGKATPCCGCYAEGRSSGRWVVAIDL